MRSLVLSALLVATVACTGAVEGSGSVPPQDAPLIECRELGGGWRYYAWEGGSRQWGRGSAPGSMELSATADPADEGSALAERIANGWNERMYRALGLPEDLDAARQLRGFQGTEEDLRRLHAEVRQLLDRMPSCLDGETAPVE